MYTTLISADDLKTLSGNFRVFDCSADLANCALSNRCVKDYEAVNRLIPQRKENNREFKN